MKNLMLAVAACAAVLGAKAENVLPDGYTAVECVMATGGQWVNTEYRPACTDKVEFKIKTSTLSQNMCVFCSRGTDTKKDTFTCFILDSSGWKFRFDRNTSVDKVSSQTVAPSTEYIGVVDGSTLACTLNGDPAATMASGTFTPGGYMTLFASHTKGTGTIATADLGNFAVYSMYSFKVTDKDGNVKVDMVPCKRDSDGVQGLYDFGTRSELESRDRFFPSQGIPFGAEIVSLAIDVPEGKSETYDCDAQVTKLAVGKNASAELTGSRSYLMSSIAPSVGEGATLKFSGGSSVSRSAAANFWIAANNSHIILDNAKFTSPAGDKVMLFKDASLQDSSFEVLNGSSLTFTDAYSAYFRVSGTRQRFIIADNSKVNLHNSANAHVGRSFMLYHAYDSVFAVSNSSFTTYNISVASSPSPESGTYAGYPGRSERNTIIFHDSAIKTYGWGHGCFFGNTVKPAEFSKDNTMIVSGTNGKTADLCKILMYGTHDTFRVEGNKVTAGEGFEVRGVSNRVEVAGGNLDKACTLIGKYPVVEVSGGTLAGVSLNAATLDPTVSVSGGTLTTLSLNSASNATVNVTGGTVTTLNMNTASNAVVSLSGCTVTTLTPGARDGAALSVGSDAKIGTVSYGATAHDREFRLVTGEHNGNQAISMNGTNNVYEVAGDSCLTGKITIAGCNNTVIIRDGAVRYNRYQNSVEFTSGGVNNTLVIDDATVIHSGAFCKSYVSMGYGGQGYTGLENCAIEVRGKAPKFLVNSTQLSSSAKAYGGWFTGASKVPAEKNTELRFRCVIPKDGWADAPFEYNPADQNNNAAYGPFMLSNTVFEVVLSDELAASRHGHMKVPLWKSTKNPWSNRTSADFPKSWCGIDALNQTAQTLGTLPEGVKLTYDSSKRTIYADIKGNCGMVIIVE